MGVRHYFVYGISMAIFTLLFGVFIALMSIVLIFLIENRWWPSSSMRKRIFLVSEDEDVRSTLVHPIITTLIGLVWVFLFTTWPNWGMLARFYDTTSHKSTAATYLKQIKLLQDESNQLNVEFASLMEKLSRYSGRDLRQQENQVIQWTTKFHSYFSNIQQEAIRYSLSTPTQLDVYINSMDSGLYTNYNLYAAIVNEEWKMDESRLSEYLNLQGARVQGMKLKLMDFQHGLEGVMVTIPKGFYKVNSPNTGGPKHELEEGDKSAKKQHPSWVKEEKGQKRTLELVMSDEGKSRVRALLDFNAVDSRLGMQFSNLSGWGKITYIEAIQNNFLRMRNVYLAGLLNLYSNHTDSFFTPLSSTEGSGFVVNRTKWAAYNCYQVVFQNGESISRADTRSEWAAASRSHSPVYCATQNGDLLYNWYAVSDPRQICPTGWRVATDVDWKELENALGGKMIAGKVLTSQQTQLDKGGLQLKLSGIRTTGLDGNGNSREDFEGTGRRGAYWTSTSHGGYSSWYRVVYDDESSVFRNDGPRNLGMGVRCVQDL